MDIKISDVLPEGEGFCPVMLNAFLQLKEEKLVAQVCRNDKNENVAVVASDKAVYAGTIGKNASYNSYLVIVDSQTSEATLVSVNETTLEIKKAEEEIEVVGATTVVELRKQFGSKKDKRRTEHIQRMKSNLDNVEHGLEKMVEDVVVNDEELEVPTVDENDSNYKPPINRDATSVEHIYELHKLVPKDVLESIDGVDAVLSGDGTDYPYTSFFKKELKTLQESSLSGAAKVNKCRILLYLDCLLRFLVCPAKSLSQKNYTPCDYSTTVSKHILETFTTLSRNGRVRPLSMKDKALCYFLVLAMIAGNYKIYLQDFSTEMKVGLKKLQELSRILSFSSSDYKNKSLFTLKVPLPAALSSLPISRKRKR